MKIAVIDGGLHHPLVVDAISREVSIIPVRDLPATNIMMFDMILILSLTDENALMQCRTILNVFINLGGVIVVLGYRAFKNNWLSQSGFRPTAISNSTSRLEDDDSKHIFGSVMKIEKSGIHAHGYLESYSSEAKILSKDIIGNAHTAIFRQNGKGTLFVTTLDPDFHIASFETSIASRDNSRYLVSKILDWAELEHKRMSFPILTKYRILYSIPADRRFKLLICLLITILATITMTAMFFNNTDDKLYLALSMASSIGSLVLALLTYKS